MCSVVRRLYYTIYVFITNFFSMKKTVMTSVLFMSLFLIGCSSNLSPTSTTNSTSSAPSIPSAPKVVSTFPVNGTQSVDPTISTIWVQFDTSMMDGSWSWAYTDKIKFPALNGQPSYTDNNTKNILPVKLKANHEYDLWINTATLTNFKDKAGNSAPPYELKFKTK